jgi:SAM-dependent methyltransferase
MSYESIFYPESKFGGFTDIDGTVAFYLRVNALSQASSVVLDVGCGRGAYAEDPVSTRRDLRILRGKVKKVIGIDVDPAAGDNPYLDEFHPIENGTWPVHDDSVDLIVCDYVLEHVEDPGALFNEVRRVLRKDGYICIRTPNLWSYHTVISMLIPNRYHAALAAKVQQGRKAEDVFRTFYMCNTTAKIRSMLNRSGCTCNVAYSYSAEPSYLSFSKLAYWFGVLHQRYAPRIFKSTILAFGRRTKQAA